jgi:hypothetical protein
MGSGGLPAPPALEPEAGAAIAYTHTGRRYVLGFTADAYGIWDRMDPAAPIVRYPRGDDGWSRVWGRYLSLEPNNAALGVVPGRRGRARSRHRTNGLSVAALVLGILWIGGIGSVLAVIFGYAARSRIDASGGLQEGRGLASASIVIGWVGVGLVLALSLLMVLVSIGSGGS